MVAGGAHSIARLTKRDVETLLATYDDDAIASLTEAMRRILDRANGTWPELVGAAGFSDTRAAALLLGEQGALDELVRELNELRDLDTR